MNGKELKAWRVGAGLSQADAAALVGVTKRTLIRCEGAPAGEVSPKIAGAVHRAQTGEAPPAPEVKAPKVKRAPAAAKGARAAEIEARRQPRPYDFEAAPDFTRGLERLPATNVAWGAAAHWDHVPALPGYQRIPGCIVKCREDIPEPIPFAPPRWARPFGVLTASGRVYHSGTGHEMREHGISGGSAGFSAPGRAKAKKPAKARA